MKKGVLVFLMLAMVMFSGCSQIYELTQKTTTIDLQNAEASRNMAKAFLLTWKLNSGFIRGALGPNMGSLPAQTVAAMDELDKLAEKQDLNDYDLGYSLGLRVRMLGQIVNEAFKIYAPEILKYVPALLKL